MPKPTTPGVYVEEVPSGIRPFEGVSTTTAAILGPVDGNPAPALVTSRHEAAALAGLPTPDGPFLPWAAEGFFLNGGTRLVIVPTDFGEDSLGSALAYLAGRTDVSLLLAPDTLNSAVVQGEAARQAIEGRLVAHAAEQRDKMVLLALPRTVSSVNDPSVAGLPSSGFAACWHPWLTAGGAHSRTMAPTGHVAGIIVRNDVHRGVHKPPANESVHGLASGPLVPSFSTIQQAPFNEAGINLIRDFRAQRRGIRVWGARTRSADPEWRHIAVRRLMIMIEQSLARGLQWAVFEPNDEPLWAKLRASAEAFLQTLWLGGALAGDKPSRAFFVRCDRTTMTEADIAAGRVILLVGVAVVKPAEFLIIRLALATGDVNA